MLVSGVLELLEMFLLSAVAILYIEYTIDEEEADLFRSDISLSLDQSVPCFMACDVIEQYTCR